MSCLNARVGIEKEVAGARHLGEIIRTLGERRPVRRDLIPIDPQEASHLQVSIYSPILPLQIRRQSRGTQVKTLQMLNVRTIHSSREI